MTDVRAALAAMRASYEQELPVLAAKVRDAAGRARTDDAALREATKTAHRIRGTAGSLGLREVSDAAGAIEDALDEARWDHLDAAVASLVALAGG